MTNEDLFRIIGQHVRSQKEAKDALSEMYIRLTTLDRMRMKVVTALQETEDRK